MKTNTTKHTGDETPKTACRTTCSHIASLMKTLRDELADREVGDNDMTTDKTQARPPECGGATGWGIRRTTNEHEMCLHKREKEEMSGYAKDIKGVLEDCERALQSIQTCVAYDGTICKPTQSDLCLVAIARDAIKEYCRLRDIKLPYTQTGWTLNWQKIRGL